MAKGERSVATDTLVKKIMDETVKSSLGISITEFYNRKLKAILKRNKIINEDN